MDNREEVIKNLRGIVQGLLSQSEAEPQFSNQDSLVVSRRLSSLQVVELAAKLEETYQLDFGTLGFDQYNFDSIDAMADLVVDSADR